MIAFTWVKGKTIQLTNSSAIAMRNPWGHASPSSAFGGSVCMGPRKVQTYRKIRGWRNKAKNPWELDGKLHAKLIPWKNSQIYQSDEDNIQSDSANFSTIYQGIVSMSICGHEATHVCPRNFPWLCPARVGTRSMGFTFGAQHVPAQLLHCSSRFADPEDDTLAP